MKNSHCERRLKTLCILIQTLLDLILQDDIRATLNEENSLFLDSIDTSQVFKRETSNSLDIISGPDEDLNNLLFKTVQAQLQVGSTTQKSNNSTNDKSTTSENKKTIQLISDNTEFGAYILPHP